MAGPWEQYQSAQPQQGPWQQYAAAPPPAAPGQRLGFTGEMDPQTRQFHDVSVDQPPQEPAVQRLAKSINAAVIGASTPQELLDQLRGDWEETKKDFADNNGAPDGTKIVAGIHAGMQELWNRATDEWKQGNYSTARGLLTKANSAIHFLQSGIPVVGPMLAHAGDQFDQRDYAGGAGTLIGLGLPALAGGIGEVSAMNTGIHTNPAPQPSLISRIPGPVAQKMATVGGAAVAGAMGHATGIPGAGEAAAVGGAALGRYLGGKFAETPEVAAPKAPALTPGEPVSAAKFFAAMKEGHSPATARMLASEASKDAVKAAGNITSAEARANYMARQKAIIDAAVPPEANRALNNKTQVEVDFQLQKGDVAKASEVLQAAKEQAQGAALPEAPQGPPKGNQALGFKADFTTTEQKAAARAKAADIWDDKLWQQRMEDLVGTDGMPAPYTNWADTFESSQAAALQRKVPTSRLGRATYSEAVKQFLEDNAIEMPKLQGAGNVIQDVPKATPKPAEDLTPILKESLKRARSGKPKPRPSQ